MTRIWKTILALGIFSGCADSVPIQDIPLYGADSVETRISLSPHALTAVFFLSSECPMCINYTRSLRQLESDFVENEVQFIGVFSGKWHRLEEVQDFGSRYSIEFPLLMDAEGQLAQRLKATVTPEVFLLDSSGKTLYSGAIDNWLNKLGKKKLEVTEHYLADAISAALQNETIYPDRTQAFGCLIE